MSLVLAVPYSLLARSLPKGTLYAVAALAAVSIGYAVWSYLVIERWPAYDGLFTAFGFFVAVGLTVGAALWLEWIPAAAASVVHLVAITLVFGYWLVLLLAVYHEFTERDVFDTSPPFGTVTVLVPAYNEEGYIGRAIESLIDADYPAGKKEIVVVDDGSTDGTYEEARQYESETVTVLRKENGGKYSALNYGLVFVDSEFVVTVDADSMVASDALERMVAALEADPGIGAVASNVKIVNRTNVATWCQSLEYIFGINIYRRVFDHFGIVPIVPGCLGAFRREVLAEVYAYDPQTLTEDFDTTMKVLLSGYDVRVSNAVVYTEAPDTWTDLYKQRLRWYRGNYMTLFKHIEQLYDPDQGYLHRLFFPLRLLEMFFLPVAGWVIVGVIGYLLLSGSAAHLLVLFVFFTSIVVLINTLAIQIEHESLRHLLYTPLFVVGYKQFHDLVMLKSLFDVLTNDDLGWTSASRVRQRRARTDGSGEPDDADNARVTAERE